MSDYSVAPVNESAQNSNQNEVREPESTCSQDPRASSLDNEARTEEGTEATSAPSVATEEQVAVGSATEEDGAPTDSVVDDGNAPTEETTQAAQETPEDELARVRDQLLRTAADFDNYRKRTRKEIADADRQGRSELLRELLPVFDNLERAAAHASSTTDVQALADGIGLVMRQFLDTLSKVGIERVQTIGKPFDPTFHEAIQHLETTEHEPGAVAAEVQAGYTLGERLIRPAMVVVAKAPSN